jgi:hypothetical protein
MLRIFSNSCFAGTEPKEAAYPVTGENSMQVMSGLQIIYSSG